MEYCDGAQINDCNYFTQNNINRYDVSIGCIAITNDFHDFDYLISVSSIQIFYSFLLYI